MTIRELLESVQLENFADAFERENITPDLLKDLTDADLRELGVTSMADRKKLQRLVSTPRKQHLKPDSPEVGASAPNKPEQVFYEGVVEDLVGNVSIRVTSHRAIIGPKTFLLHNIAAVQVRTTVGGSKNVAKIGGVCLAVVCFGVAIGIAADGKYGDGKSETTTCCVALGLVCLAGLFGKDTPPTYSVSIDASGTSSNAITSLNKAKMQEIVDAINQAIINLDVAK